MNRHDKQNEIKIRIIQTKLKNASSEGSILIEERDVI